MKLSKKKELERKIKKLVSQYNIPIIVYWSFKTKMKPFKTNLKK